MQINSRESADQVLRDNFGQGKTSEVIIEGQDGGKVRQLCDDINGSAMGVTCWANFGTVGPIRFLLEADPRTSLVSLPDAKYPEIKGEVLSFIDRALTEGHTIEIHTQ